MAKLTPEERELCIWYADGVPVTEMAEWRHSSERTIYNELAAVRKTLAVAGLTVKRLLAAPQKQIRSLNPDVLADC